MPSSYYDIDAILADEERVFVTFQTDVTGAGRALDPSCDNDDLALRSRVELPYWLIPELHQRNMITMHLPRIFGQKFRKEVQAEPLCVNLRECSPYYYTLGMKLAPSFKSTQEFLLQLFRKRYEEMLARGHTISDEEVNRSRKLLTKEEAKLLHAASSSMQSFSQWAQRGQDILRIAPILGKNRRKREALASIDVNSVSQDFRAPNSRPRY
eukprot:TRINITY_DN17288_c0_g1_i1.p2 TRINITY_DN17288_c0_g1~~TRINITY_DN17288_c0_g1_i1.p2  ORF type:complete len:211 (+),score=38.63 TRINITY_DN17288_c0_g1_i1:447-1079(+)